MTNPQALDRNPSPALTCPHCLGEIPFGATVCRGCQGEVRYGAPRWANVGAVLVALIVWANTIARSPRLAIVAGMTVGLVLLLLARWAFRKRVAISRTYRR